MSTIDRWVDWSTARVAHARQAWMRASGRGSGVAGLLAADSGPVDFFDKLSATERRQLAMRLSWVYADIRLVAQEFSSATLRVKVREGERLRDVANHPFELLLQKPNDEMDATFIWQYTIQWMQIAGKAYWYLAPRRSNSGEIVEIWPIPADRLTPVPGKTRLVDRYLYRTRMGTSISVDPDFIVFFRYANPFNLLDGSAPLGALTTAIETEVGQGTWQRDAYVAGRGIPHTVLLLDKNMNDRDFASVSETLREDFEKERKIAIARGGDLKVATVGIPQKDMELIASRKFTRDEIDTVLLGVALHATGESAQWLAGADKLFVDKVVWPLHVLMAGQMTVQILHRYYGEEYVAAFDDVRPQDRSLLVQERNVYWQGLTFDEVRAELGKPAFVNPALPGYGDLPLILARDANLVAQMYGLQPINPENAARQRGSPPEIGEQARLAGDRNASLPQSDAPARIAHREAARGLTQAERDELKRWRRVALREWAAGRNPGERAFRSAVLPQDIVERVQQDLFWTDGEEAIKAVFDPSTALRAQDAMRSGGEQDLHTQFVAMAREFLALTGGGETPV